MTTSDLEKQLLQLPPKDKLRIIELLIKSLGSFLTGNDGKNLSTRPQAQKAVAYPQKAWPELVQSLAGTWADFPSLQEIRSDVGTESPWESL